MTRNERMEMGRPDRGLPPVLFVLAVLPALAALPATAAAAGPGEEKKPMVVEGTVVQLEDNELVVDLGREQGLPGDAVVQLYRRLEVTHPLTKKVLVDRFPLGKIRLSEVGSLLSIARNIEGLSRPPKAGDFVVFEPRPVQPVARLEPAGGVGAGTASAPATTP
ncbi:MAG: hypothetical protein FJ125_12765, partial [Deltaproteobacteria bacterium]|nr:hypothetical protein [Deltaproteobacteria bacterium]